MAQALLSNLLLSVHPQNILFFCFSGFVFIFLFYSLPRQISFIQLLFHSYVRFFSPLDGQEIGLALNKRLLSTLKTLLRLIGPEMSHNNVFASALQSHAGKKEDGIYAVFEGLLFDHLSW